MFGMFVVPYILGHTLSDKGHSIRLLVYRIIGELKLARFCAIPTIGER